MNAKGCGLALGLVLALGGAASAQTLAPGQLPVLPLTQIDERALAADLDNRAFMLTFAQPIPIRELLLLLVRGTSLSVIPDPTIAGSFIGELKNVTVRQALGLILPPLGLDYQVDGGFVRVFRREPETRLFDVNYIATQRAGASIVGGTSAGGGSATVTSSTRTDVFEDIAKGVETLLSEGATYNLDRKAGLLQITDFPERFDRVALYLDTVHEHVHRQVQISARVIEVELADPEAQSLDWAALAESIGAGNPSGVNRPMLSGLRPGDVPRFLDALAAQGRVSVLASPSVLALNNEPTVVRAASQEAADGRGRPRDESMTLGVTPQIAAEGIVMLSLSPMVAVREADEGRRPTAVTSIRETDTLARVADGETIVVAGLTREREVRERRPPGTRGGWFGRSTMVTKKRVELVMLLTPTILSPPGTH